MSSVYLGQCIHWFNGISVKYLISGSLIHVAKHSEVATCTCTYIYYHISFPQYKLGIVTINCI